MKRKQVIVVHIHMSGGDCGYHAVKALELEQALMDETSLVHLKLTGRGVAAEHVLVYDGLLRMAPPATRTLAGAYGSLAGAAVLLWLRARRRQILPGCCVRIPRHPDHSEGRGKFRPAGPAVLCGEIDADPGAAAAADAEKLVADRMRELLPPGFPLGTNVYGGQLAELGLTGPPPPEDPAPSIQTTSPIAPHAGKTDI